MNGKQVMGGSRSRHRRNLLLAVAMGASLFGPLRPGTASAEPPPQDGEAKPKDVEAPSKDGETKPNGETKPVETRPNEAALKAPGGEPKTQDADPVSDGALLLGALGFASLSEAILTTGEIRPQQIDANFDTGRLLPLDRAALSQNLDSTADTFSNIGAYMSFGYAALDITLSGITGGKETALVDFTLYAQAISFSWGLTNLAKIGFRRPRPIAYIERERAILDGADPNTYNNTSTDSALSFYSGHTALTATVSATATYLAFARSPHTMRPWATLAGSILLTSFVGVERVRSGAHFPTDVIAGAFAGVGVGVIVAHLHRYDTENKRPVWLGYMPTEGGGGVSLSGRF